MQAQCQGPGPPRQDARLSPLYTRWDAGRWGPRWPLDPAMSCQEDEGETGRWKLGFFVWRRRLRKGLRAASSPGVNVGMEGRGF